MSTATETSATEHAYVPLARRASAWHDFVTIAHRAIRGMFREPEFFIPALITPVFFFVVQVGALQDFAEGSGTVVDFKAFQLPVAIIFAVTGVSRASAIVTDIQSGYFDRLLLTPVRRQMLLLGLMAADFLAVILLTIPVLLLGLVLGVTLRDGNPGHDRVPALRRDVGSGVRRVPLRDRPQDREPGRGERQLHPVLPVRVPHHDASCPKRPSPAGCRRWRRTTRSPTCWTDLRSVVSTGWEMDRLLQGFAASIGLMVISFGLASLALAGRIKRG